MSDLVLAHRQELVDIADAIRAANGTTSGIKIDEIPQLIEDLGVKYTSGTYTASTTGSAATITHGLGITPSIIIFIRKGTFSTPSSTGACSTYHALMSVKTFSSYYYCGADPGYFTSQVRSYCSTTGSYIYTTKYYYYNGLVRGTSTDSRYGVNSITSSSFKTPSYLTSGTSYAWYAIGGL